jgi:hypothetical protein
VSEKEFSLSSLLKLHQARYPTLFTLGKGFQLQLRLPRGLCVLGMVCSIDYKERETARVGAFFSLFLFQRAAWGVAKLGIYIFGCLFWVWR